MTGVAGHTSQVFILGLAHQFWQNTLVCKRTGQIRKTWKPLKWALDYYDYSHRVPYSSDSPLKWDITGTSQEPQCTSTTVVSMLISLAAAQVTVASCISSMSTLWTTADQRVAAVSWWSRLKESWQESWKFRLTGSRSSFVRKMSEISIWDCSNRATQSGQRPISQKDRMPFAFELWHFQYFLCFKPWIFQANYNATVTLRVTYLQHS